VRPAVSAPAPPPERLPPFDAPPPAPIPAKVRPSQADQPDVLGRVLAGAGLPPDAVTPELAENFGAILRIVVAGVMEILRARQEIKDEFRMRMTQFRPADNNPLKFSANVDDALHNLLVKRNAAYLGAVEAFEDAFKDLRNHQIAMLNGMRMAFESMLSEFDPDKLQEQFDRQLKRASLFGGPAKLRYWDLYRERQDELVRDPEKTFQKLFGEVFAKAYDEQLQRLRIRGRDVDD
jgi:type VI secretion system FHA domain protein